MGLSVYVIGYNIILLRGIFGSGDLRGRIPVPVRQNLNDWWKEAVYIGLVSY